MESQKQSFTCRDCGKAFTTSDYFYMRNSGVSLTCKTCHNSENVESNRHPTKKFKCTDCDKEFASLNEVHVHRVVLHTQSQKNSFTHGKRPKCTMCNKKFSNPVERHRHFLLVHLSAEKALSEMNLNSTNSKGEEDSRGNGCAAALEPNRASTVEGERSVSLQVIASEMLTTFKCNKCELEFASLLEREAHIRTSHSTAPAMKTRRVCGKRRSDESEEIDVQMADIQAMAGKFTCMECGVQFLSPQARLEHYRQKHLCVSKAETCAPHDCSKLSELAQIVVEQTRNEKIENSTPADDSLHATTTPPVEAQ